MPGIFLRASAVDSNSGASAFVGFAVPLGIVNGDIAIVAVALPAGVTVAPPDASWTQVGISDPTQFGIACFWATVINAPSSWVFSLSSSVTTCGALAVYANTDTFNPFDASAISVSAQAGSLAGVTASLNGDELAAFFVGADNGTFTPTSGYAEAQAKSTSAASISFQHQALQDTVRQSPIAETFSQTAAGAAIVIALAPSASAVTYDDAYQRVYEALPPGIDNLLDFSPTGDFYKFFWVIGSALKLGFDLLDLARQEIIPYLSRYKLPDWERAFGLGQTRTTLSGTIPQRQQQVLGSWRAAAGQSASFQTVAATLGPLLGYFPSTPVQIIEADRSYLKLLHSYDFCDGVDVTLNQGTTTTLLTYVNDGGKVSKMGAQLALAFGTSDSTFLSFVLTAPDGTSKTWAAGTTTTPLWLTAPELAGAKIQGMWMLEITNNSPAMGSYVILYSSLQLFVEGIARGQQTGGAIFTWGVYADPAHIGENGTPPDFAAARTAIKKLALSHTVGGLLQSTAPYPGVSSGLHAAIPGECLPT